MNKIVFLSVVKNRKYGGKAKSNVKIERFGFLHRKLNQQ